MEGSGGYWFKSSLFAAEPGEDDATNPRLYGRQLANWLRERILSLGYPAVDVIAEDWGWCVMCQREPYELWIGCVNLARKPEMREGLARLDAQLRSVLQAEPAIEIVDESVANTWFADLPKVHSDADAEPTALPRWIQVIAGLLLLPITLLCVAGALTMFTLPNVQTDPFLQLLTVVITLLCIWGVVIAVRLIFGLKGKGLLGPLALRLMSAVAIGAVVGSFFTDIYTEAPVRAVALVIIYVALAVRLWRLAARRSQR